MHSQVVETRVLCVDLDGTLVATDLLWESLVSAVRRNPLVLLSLPWWMLRGRAYLKQRLAGASAIDFSTLPYREEVLAFVDRERRRGRPVVLATAADHTLASGVSSHLGIFSEVIASDGVINLKGRAKAAWLTDRFGRGNFDYIGDSHADVPCWECAATAISANAATRPEKIPHLRTLTTGVPGVPWSALVKALRPHQWVKNVLMLIPALAAHRLDAATLVALVLGLVSLSLCASGGYVLNDLLDVAADRQHARKRYRPFASGRLSLSTGLWLILATWGAGFTIAATLLPGAFAGIVGVYLATTVAYSIRIKREPVLDVMVLAALYVIRVVAGGVATSIVVSTWLLAFTLFMSISLAFMKRFIEVAGRSEGSEVPGRAYLTSDAAWLHSTGLCSAYLASMVLAIYVNNADVAGLYNHPERLLLMCPIVLYWATRTWLKAHRRLLHDDPVVAVARDPATYVIGALSAVVVISATW
jgi:4-hydroxybenzoate polyprenyltransferase